MEGRVLLTPWPHTNARTGMGDWSYQNRFILVLEGLMDATFGYDEKCYDQPGLDGNLPE